MQSASFTANKVSNEGVTRNTFHMSVSKVEAYYCSFFVSGEVRSSKYKSV